MTPKKTTIEGEADERKKAVCDEIIFRAASMMIDEAGASMAMMLDRVLTFAAAQSCTVNGSPMTAAAFRQVADKVEAGVFHHLTGENTPNAERH
ncbi:hypothetical protein GOB15_23750 [Sinorhizobium meliloti]|nr:hypothetical protein [Sinorhizobium meliloti]MDW9512865.1 hypothetical protein [Sinorhizobium meliloti]